MLRDGVRAVPVNPEEAAPVPAALRRLHLQPAGILVTHHFTDAAVGANGKYLADGAH